MPGEAGILKADFRAVRDTRLCSMLANDAGTRIGTVEHLLMAKDLGVNTIRVATHCTEADVSKQHIEAARNLGMDVSGFLMMSHMQTPQGLAQQAKLMESYGAHTVYVTDSAGYMLPDDVKARIGRSPDRGDAVVMCLAEGKRSEVRAKRRARHSFDMQQRANVGHNAVKSYYRR